MTAWLLDANVLIALSTTDHVHHARVRKWCHGKIKRFATCPMTQSALLRFQLRFGKDVTVDSAWRLLMQLTQLPSHEFWPDGIEFNSVPSRGLTGHKQVNDAYLVEMARCRKGRLATLDVGLAKLHSDVAFLIPH